MVASPTPNASQSAALSRAPGDAERNGAIRWYQLRLSDSSGGRSAGRLMTDCSDEPAYS